jgi:hypothetical protein
MYHIGGSLTDLYTTHKPQMSGGDPLSAQDILNNVSNVDSIPNVLNSAQVDSSQVNPDLSTSVTDKITDKIKDIVIEGARSAKQSSFSVTDKIKDKLTDIVIEGAEQSSFSVTDKIKDKLTDIVIEGAEQSSFSFSAIFNTFLAYTTKLIFVVFEIENKTMHNGILALVWILMGGILFGIASTISNTNITFILYCCALWIIVLAVLFIFIQPYRLKTAV